MTEIQTIYRARSVDELSDAVDELCLANAILDSQVQEARTLARRYYALNRALEAQKSTWLAEIGRLRAELEWVKKGGEE